MFERQNRVGVVVYLYYNRDARKIQKFGDFHYHSRKSRYIILYVNKEELADKVKDISKLKFVKEVKMSELDSIDRDFVGNLYR
ncbi:DUF2129 domain-containing protein [Streptococcus pseudoporcinus]|uniref:UPF0298 protein NCTC5385_01864 n=2 Tax=Streptococcus pseudoporcinus TaxID=361101 RepID=A0A4U9ZB65_9STRE|nr:DUF2129 domain-containing protein [Streptococcus pseudoporcinus]EFR43489.1 hypothetical protein HMPREF9320_0270 [Streptococcus pseudoporcinus SPIN 20026]EHI64698.1 hypothetical protein STRPS_1498 [Streptococcus pseudoporcinus LQ 940-04]VEF94357.1 hypothetical cytosolic protein [Streptococcus pseudoporcinus]VTS18660.1 hypothetical cytosolic protein [Streptococcus pseudoporcinus]VTS36796.1 hypothetical cytosolic protein [Streptococcus pseudoporcinus]